MPKKIALIVDDSRTAQFKLTKALESYDLIIDTALSAEDALSYLSCTLPDVIFMDHSMKGMDGLDAVKIIKSNASTATIPVVMYTAQSGEVYLSQARAMGAMDVLSKDSMTDLDIQRAMSSLKIVAAANAVDEPDLPPQIQANAQTFNTDLVKLSDQVSNSLDIQQQQVSRQLQDNSRLLVNRFMSETRGLRDEVSRQKKLDREFLNVKLETINRRGFFEVSPIWFCAVSTLLVGLSWALYGVNNANDRNAQLLHDKQTLTQTVAKQNDRIKSHDSLSKAKLVAGTNGQIDKLLDALVWAINQKGRFEFSETALGESRTEMIAGLLQHLGDVDFTGTLTLGIHNGDFCVVRDQAGALALPEPLVSLNGCDLLSNTAYSFDTASQTSLPFLNLLQSSPIVLRGDLQIDIKAHGLSKPSNRYPEFSDVVTSEQWNTIALANNRLDISLQN